MCDMAAIITSGTITTSSAVARAEEIRTAFIENKQALTWLAEFLTGDEMIASACVIDACNLTEREYEIGQEWFWTWPRNATIHSALDIQRSRISQLSPVYDHGGCIHEYHAPLSQDMIGFVASESDSIRHKLDVLCRFVLILCGVEQCPPCEAARLLGISKHAVDVAYCAALESLEIIWCQAILESGGCVAPFN
jgi:DNA-directed RNA polymerase specialized sigma24 family protein